MLIQRSSFLPDGNPFTLNRRFLNRFNMPNIDLERLIVRHTYFVPLKTNQLKDAIFDELDVSDPDYHKIKPWYVREEHGNCFAFERSFRWLYVDRKTSHRPKKEEITNFSKEYSRKGTELEFEILGYIIDNLPLTIYVRVERILEKGCEIEVECLPALYQKLNRLDVVEVKEFKIQDAVLTCSRFLRDIFVGGLNATAISEVKTKLPKKVTEFLTNDIASQPITEKITELLENATTEILVFGWIGTILLKKLRELKQKGIEIKVITGLIKGIRQDVMKKEKQRAMKELISIIGKDNISIKPEFHGRAVIVDNKALIGSMDLDSYSLTGTRIEFATYTEDPEIVRSLRNYFNRIFTPWKEEKAKG